ncbi:MAG: hypothetical protein YYHSYBAR_000653 [Candidatus Fervidibacter sacchari]
MCSKATHAIGFSQCAFKCAKVLSAKCGVQNSWKSSGVATRRRRLFNCRRGKPRRYFYHPLFAHYLTEGFGLLEGSDFSLPKKKLTHQKMFPKKAEKKSAHQEMCPPELLKRYVGSLGDEPSRIGEKDAPAHQDAPSSLMKVNG